MPYKDYETKKARERERYWRNKDEHNAYHREYAKNNREKINQSVRELKQRKREYLLDHLGGKCVGCGSIDNLQFDHIDRKEKKFTIGKCWGYTLEKLLEEANKCQLLCKDCHQYKTIINHDTDILADGYKIKEIKHINNDVVVTLSKVSQDL